MCPTSTLKTTAQESLDKLRGAGLLRGVWGKAFTPSGGIHILFAPSGAGNSNHGPGKLGLDYRGKAVTSSLPRRFWGKRALADGSDEGEGIGHLFWARDKDAQDIKRYTPAVILSAAEIDTLSAASLDAVSRATQGVDG
jgi:hypothetical protein